MVLDIVGIWLGTSYLSSYVALNSFYISMQLPDPLELWISVLKLTTWHWNSFCCWRLHFRWSLGSLPNSWHRYSLWTLPICLDHEFTQKKTVKDLQFEKLYPMSWPSVRLSWHAADLSGVSSQMSWHGASEEPTEWEMLFPTGPSCSLPLRCLLLMHLVCLLLLEETQSYLCQTLVILGLAIQFNVGFRASWRIYVDRYYFTGMEIYFLFGIPCSVVDVNTYVYKGSSMAELLLLYFV